MNDALPSEGRALLLDIISELPQEYNLSDEIASAEISSGAVAGGRSCDVYCASIPWEIVNKNTLVTSRCRSSENERGARVLKVAVKRARTYILNTFDSDNLLKFAKRHAREILVWSSLDHINILPMLGYAHDDTILPSLITPWMDNGTARQYLKKNRNTTLLIALTKGVTKGLSYLHMKGIKHGDLKADNILISAVGAPLLADFGISRAINSGEFPSLATSSYSISGTLRWMARELVADDDGKAHSLATDVWSYGMTIYEFVTGRIPYDFISREPAVIRAIVDCNPPHGPIYPFLTSVPERLLMGICEMCWQKSPDIRPTAEELLRIIENIFREVDSETAHTMDDAAPLPYKSSKLPKPEPVSCRTFTHKADTQWSTTTTEDLCFSSFPGSGLLAASAPGSGSMSVNPGPLFVSSSLAGYDMGMHFGGSAALTTRHLPSVAHIQPSSSSDPILQTGDPTPAVSDTDPSLFMPNNDAELFRNYYCCGIPLRDFHGLVQHFEEAHSAVASSNSSTFTPDAYGAASAAGPQQNFATSAIPSAQMPSRSGQEQSQQLQRQQRQAQRYLAHRPSDSAIANTFSRGSVAPWYSDAIRGDLVQEQKRGANSVEHDLGLGNLTTPWAHAAEMEGVTYPHYMPMRSASPASSISSHTGSVGSNLTGSWPIAPCGNTSNTFTSQVQDPAFDLGFDSLGLGGMGLNAGMMQPSMLFSHGQGLGTIDGLQTSYSSQANSPSTSRSGSPMSLKRSISRDSWVSSPDKYSSALQGNYTVASSSSSVRAKVTPLRPDAPQNLSKPFKCPKPGCSKSYKQANGLKYHITHGRCSTSTSHDSNSSQSVMEREAGANLKPYCCQVPPCQRRYKNLNGLRYHYLHSGEHGAIGLQMLAEGRHDAMKSHDQDEQMR